ncbi:hypothetical protein R3I94_009132 [Phoxinus phoxinus]
MREPSMTQDSLNTGCVWSVQSSEAEIWDVRTDIHCNDGLLLMDGQSITPAGHRSDPSIHSYCGDLAGL